MSPALDDEARVRVERQVLQAMCQGTVKGSVRELGMALLGNYRWREPAHQAIFSCLVELSAQNLEVVRSHLPERLTRKGFPDIEWNDLYAPHSLSHQKVERLMRQLGDLR